LEEILKIFSKQQNLRGIYNPIDWHKGNSLLARLKLASLPELPALAVRVFVIGSIWLQSKGASIVIYVYRFK
jgi:hypothetical protein